MMPAPRLDAEGPLLAWRLDRASFAHTWDSGIGAFNFGGRWNTRGTLAVYCAADPSTAILELAAHVGFSVLDTVPHVLSCACLLQGPLHIVHPQDIPNPAWLNPGTPSAGQQQFGSRLLSEHGIVLFPSTISRYSWNVVIEPTVAAKRYQLRSQAPFVLDTRLHPPGM